MPRSYLRIALLGGALHTMIAPALAQQAPQAAPQAADSDAPADAERAIVVIGTRKQAADIQFQSSHPISVLSEEDLRHTAVHNVAEALGLLPGVNVVNTGSSFIGGVDGASRGEGMYVAIRGLNSEYNVNLINGVNVAQGQPYSRGVQLTLLPPTGLNTIVLNKASRADMDGDAIGGTVDFRTPSAFDYSDRLHGSVTASGRPKPALAPMATAAWAAAWRQRFPRALAPATPSASTSAAITTAAPIPTARFAARNRRMTMAVGAISTPRTVRARPIPASIPNAMPRSPASTPACRAAPRAALAATPRSTGARMTPPASICAAPMPRR
jgi:hypothetical protein